MKDASFQYAFAILQNTLTNCIHSSFIGGCHPTCRASGTFIFLSILFHFMFHSAAYATCQPLLEPGVFLSRAGRSQVLFGMTISVHPSRYLLRVILHAEKSSLCLHSILKFIMFTWMGMSHMREVAVTEIDHAD